MELLFIHLVNFGSRTVLRLIPFIPVAEIVELVHDVVFISL